MSNCTNDYRQSNSPTEHNMRIYSFCQLECFNANPESSKRDQIRKRELKRWAHILCACHPSRLLFFCPAMHGCDPAWPNSSHASEWSNWWPAQMARTMVEPQDLLRTQQPPLHQIFEGNAESSSRLYFCLCACHPLRCRVSQMSGVVKSSVAGCQSKWLEQRSWSVSCSRHHKHQATPLRSSTSGISMCCGKLLSVACMIPMAVPAWWLHLLLGTSTAATCCGKEWDYRLQRASEFGSQENCWMVPSVKYFCSPNKMMCRPARSKADLAHLTWTLQAKLHKNQMVLWSHGPQ